jgi:hypothetical protein
VIKQKTAQNSKGDMPLGSVGKKMEDNTEAIWRYLPALSIIKTRSKIITLQLGKTTLKGRFKT